MISENQPKVVIFYSSIYKMKWEFILFGLGEYKKEYFEELNICYFGSKPKKIDAIIELLKPFSLQTVARTGTIALPRG